MPGVGRSVQLADVTAAAVTATVDTLLSGSYKGGTFVLDVTSAATAAADTLTVYIQRLLADGTYDDVVAFTAVLGNGGAVAYVADVLFDSAASDERVVSTNALTAGTVNAVPMSHALRVSYVIVNDTTPLFDFTVSADLFN
jgi:hypothetical protein